MGQLLRSQSTEVFWVLKHLRPSRMPRCTTCGQWDLMLMRPWPCLYCTCCQRWQAELPVSTAVQQLCGCSEPRRVEWDGKCPWWRKWLHGCKSHLLWRGPDLYLNCRAWECRAPTEWDWNCCRLDEYHGEVTFCIAPLRCPFWDICFQLQGQDQSWCRCCSYVSWCLAGFFAAFKGKEVWCLPNVFWTNPLKDWRSYLGLN